MSKNWILTLVVTVMLFGYGVVSSVAQSKTSVIPEIAPAVAQQAENVVSLVRSNPEQGEKAFSDLLKTYKKDEITLTTIGYYLLNKGLTDQALEAATQVYKREPSYVPGLLLYGDVYMAKKDLGTANQKYEEALYYNANCGEAYLRSAQALKQINPQLAIETLLKLKGLQQTADPEVDRELASIYYKTNDIDKAISTYEIYFGEENSPKLDAFKEYALLLFLKGEYKKSLEVIDKAMVNDPKEISFARMKFYNLVKEENYTDAKVAADALFDQYADSLLNFNDYAYRGMLNNKLKDYTAALSDFGKSLELNPENIALYKDMSDSYEFQGKYDEAITSFKTFLDKIGDKRDIKDIFSFGRLYYTAASSLRDKPEDPKLLAYVAGGDSAFAVVEAKTESYMGSLWRARINSLRDTQNPVEQAKVGYEEALKRLEGKDSSYDSERKESYNYLSFYFMKKEDNATARNYNQKALAIDPNDALAKQIASVLK